MIHISSKHSLVCVKVFALLSFLPRLDEYFARLSPQTYSRAIATPGRCPTLRRLMVPARSVEAALNDRRRRLGIWVCFRSINSSCPALASTYVLYISPDDTAPAFSDSTRDDCTAWQTSCTTNAPSARIAARLRTSKTMSSYPRAVPLSVRMTGTAADGSTLPQPRLLSSAGAGGAKCTALRAACNIVSGGT